MTFHYNAVHAEMGENEDLTKRDEVVELLDELRNDPKHKQLSSKR